MTRYALRRATGAVVVFVLAAAAIFLVARVVPGDPIATLGGGRALAPESRAALAERYNLDEPLPTQYARYMTDLLRGDLGESIQSRRPVRSVLGDAFPRTARLAALAVAFEVLVAVPLGVWVARRPAGWPDRALLATSVVVLSTPVLVLATTAQHWLAARGGIVPVSGDDAGLVAYLLPALVLAVANAAVTLRVTRAEVEKALRSPAIAAARGRGVPERRVLGRHALRPALIPVVTVLGVNLGVLFGGAIVVEKVFNLRGVGYETWRAVASGDFPVVVGVSLALVALFLVLNLVVDLLYAALDPRVSHG